MYCVEFAKKTCINSWHLTISFFPDFLNMTIVKLLVMHLHCSYSNPIVSAMFRLIPDHWLSISWFLGKILSNVFTLVHLVFFNYIYIYIYIYNNKQHSPVEVKSNMAASLKS